MSEALDPLTLPLQGSRLIEASAGTGKTWTIAALYVRLVLGHGALGRPLVPGEILVMTFTKAATRELADRIRGRLVQAAARFRGEPPRDEEEDGFLAGLLAAFPEGPARQQAAWRLALAAEAMDDAAIHTIDAWCQRMLREHAFDSGCLFDEELQPNEAAVLADAVRDYWRQQVYPLDAAAFAAVQALWPDVVALEKDVLALLEAPLPPGAGEGSLDEAIERAARARREVLAALKAGWPQRADEMLAWLEPVWTNKAHPARKKLPAQGHASGWIRKLRDWSLDEAASSLDLTKTAVERLSHAAVRAAFAHDPAAVIPTCFAEFDALLAALKRLPDTGPALRLHAAAGVRARMLQLKAQAGAFGFADMLNRLERALDASVQGEKARRLRQRIIDQYPAALVDEFQDTSPVQLRIFERLYRLAENDPARVLLLIGDPKQAIYAFRGADIHSYLWAREATRGRHHVLSTNHRSTQELVEAVNRLFAGAEKRPGEGAFQFREAAADAAAAAGALPFVEVRAKGRPERLVIRDGDMPAVTLVADHDLRNTAASRGLFAALCAERIVTLLNDPRSGFIETGVSPEATFRRLRPADIAVLVRTGTEAEEVRRALRRRGLASVYLSDKDTVFQTDEAADLLRLLQAVAAPRDVRLARAALATTLLGLTLPELVALATDDERFDRQWALLQELNADWKNLGVLALLRRALHAFGLPARWLAAGAPGEAGQGERRLTNVLHLAELLQAASLQVEGEQALVRWFSCQIGESDSRLAVGDDLVLRLESDADLVQVVTVHKSKGLEYPLVFLPFPALVRPDDRRGLDAFVLPAAQGGQRLVLSPTPEEFAAHQKEEQREALRLLYVALTRARHALWVGVAGHRGLKGPTWHRSALGYLLSGPTERPPEQRLRDLQALAQACPQVVVEAVIDVVDDAVGEPVGGAGEGLPLPTVTPLQARGPMPALAPLPAYAASFDRSWSISSYSALVRNAPRGTAVAGAVALVRPWREDEPPDADRDPGLAGPSPRRLAAWPWHRFPRGAFAGNFLHDQLEWLAAEDFALDDSDTVQEALRRRCDRQGWGHRAADVVDWLRRVCTTPLPVLGVPLAGLRTHAPEMEFWIPTDGLRAGQVDALCRRHLLPGRERPALPERALNGMLMGFADLVFEHDGRHWVLDYKSNALGGQDADYTAGAMEAAMLEHRYDVQAALYLLALHRLLQARLGPAYDPARQLGGAVYLFLRGVNGPAAGCCHLRPPPALLGALDALLPRRTDGLARDVA